MKRKIKFGFLTLLVLAISMNFAIAQQSKQPEKPNASSPEYQTLKKDWDTFQVKAEANAVDPAQKPVLEKEYNGLVERLENICEGIKPAPAKAPVKVATSTMPSDKPKKEQVSAMK